MRCSSRLNDLGLGWRRQLSAEDAVPEAACDAEAVLVVREVVLKVVLFECVPIGRETVVFVSMCDSVKGNYSNVSLTYLLWCKK